MPGAASESGHLGLLFTGNISPIIDMYHIFLTYLFISFLSSFIHFLYYYIFIILSTDIPSVALSHSTEGKSCLYYFTSCYLFLTIL